MSAASDPVRPKGAAHSPLKSLAAAALAVLAAVALAAGCGGGTSQYDPFVPEGLVAFGDEATALVTVAGGTPASAGRNYSINGINDNGTTEDTSDDFVDCTIQPNWAQSLAAAYGFAFAECPGTLTEFKAVNRARAGARVADVTAQIDAQVAAGGFGPRHLAAVMIGVNDVLDLYRRFDGTNEAALTAEAHALGVRAGQAVNRLIDLGAKVVVSNIPDLGYTPFAVKEEAANPGAGRGGLLSRLSLAFNERLGVTVFPDGRFVALVQADQRVLAMAVSPGAFAIANVTEAACTTAPPECTTATLATNATASTWLWATDWLLSPRGQSEIASLAIARAQRNPF